MKTSIPADNQPDSSLDVSGDSPESEENVNHGNVDHQNRNDVATFASAKSGQSEVSEVSAAKQLKDSSFNSKQLKIQSIDVHDDSSSHSLTFGPDGSEVFLREVNGKASTSSGESPKNGSKVSSPMSLKSDTITSNSGGSPKGGHHNSSGGSPKESHHSSGSPKGGGSPQGAGNSKSRSSRAHRELGANQNSSHGVPKTHGPKPAKVRPLSLTKAKFPPNIQCDTGGLSNSPAPPSIPYSPSGQNSPGRPGSPTIGATGASVSGGAMVGVTGTVGTTGAASSSSSPPPHTGTNALNNNYMGGSTPNSIALIPGASPRFPAASPRFSPMIIVPASAVPAKKEKAEDGANLMSLSKGSGEESSTHGIHHYKSDHLDLPPPTPQPKNKKKKRMAGDEKGISKRCSSGDEKSRDSPESPAAIDSTTENPVDSNTDVDAQNNCGRNLETPQKPTNRESQQIHSDQDLPTFRGDKIGKTSFVEVFAMDSDEELEQSTEEIFKVNRKARETSLVCKMRELYERDPEDGRSDGKKLSNSIGGGKSTSDGDTSKASFGKSSKLSKESFQSGLSKESGVVVELPAPSHQNDPATRIQQVLKRIAKPSGQRVSDSGASTPTTTPFGVRTPSSVKKRHRELEEFANFKNESLQKVADANVLLAKLRTPNTPNTPNTAAFFGGDIFPNPPNLLNQPSDPTSGLVDVHTGQDMLDRDGITPSLGMGTGLEGLASLNSLESLGSLPSGLGGGQDAHSVANSVGDGDTEDGLSDVFDENVSNDVENLKEKYTLDSPGLISFGGADSPESEPGVGGILGTMSRKSKKSFDPTQAFGSLESLAAKGLGGGISPSSPTSASGTSGPVTGAGGIWVGTRRMDTMERKSDTLSDHGTGRASADSHLSQIARLSEVNNPARRSDSKKDDFVPRFGADTVTEGSEASPSRGNIAVLDDHDELGFAVSPPATATSIQPPLNVGLPPGSNVGLVPTVTSIQPPSNVGLPVGSNSSLTPSYVVGPPPNVGLPPSGLPPSSSSNLSSVPPSNVGLPPSSSVFGPPATNVRLSPDTTGIPSSRNVGLPPSNVSPRGSHPTSAKSLSFSNPATMFHTPIDGASPESVSGANVLENSKTSQGSGASALGYSASGHSASSPTESELAAQKAAQERLFQIELEKQQKDFEEELQRLAQKRKEELAQIRKQQEDALEREKAVSQNELQAKLAWNEEQQLLFDEQMRTIEEEERLRKETWLGWTLTHDSCGGMFFYHVENQLSQWEQPEELNEVLGVWEEVPETPECQKFYRNNVANLSLWSDPRDTTSVFKAALDGNLAYLNLYLHFCADSVDVIDTKNNRTALHYATAGGYDEAVQALILGNADPNSRDIEDATPLHYACRYGYSACVKTLLDAGADWTAIKGGTTGGPGSGTASPNNDGDSPGIINPSGSAIATTTEAPTVLHEAVLMGQTDAVACLIYFSCDLPLSTVKNNELLTPIQLASRRGYHEIVRLLAHNLGIVGPQSGPGGATIGEVDEEEEDSDDSDDSDEDFRRSSHSSEDGHHSSSQQNPNALQLNAKNALNPGLMGPAGADDGFMSEGFMRSSSSSSGLHVANPAIIHHASDGQNLLTGPNTNTDMLQPDFDDLDGNDKSYHPLTTKIIGLAQPILRKVHKTVNQLMPQQAHIEGNEKNENSLKYDHHRKEWIVNSG